MRIKFMLSIMTLFFVCSIAFIPAAILSMSTHVEVTPVTTRDYRDRIYCSGEIVDKHVKEIYLDTPVIAREVAVEIGDLVTHGQVLATVNTELTQSVLAQGATATDLGSALPVGNLSELAKQYGLSEADVSAVMAQYTGASAHTREVENGFIPQAIVAPMNGVVTEINMQTDVLTQSSRPVLVISDASSYRAKVSVSEADVSRLAPGDTAVITGSGFEGCYKGIVTKIYPTARKKLSGTTQSTVVDVEITLQEPDARLKPGFTVKAAITSQSGVEALAVPYSAIEQGLDNREYVYVYQSNRVTKRYIQTGKETADSVQVLEGLLEGERIVTNPSSIQDEEALVYLANRGGSSE